MNFQFYLEKLFANKNFQEFIEKNKTAYPCSCFFVVDKQGKDNKQHFDYYTPETKEIFSFKMESGGEKVPVEVFENIIPSKISLNYNFDFDEIWNLIEERIQKENMKNKIQKMLLSLQNVDGKELLVGTIFISMMGLIQVHVDISKMGIIHFEKKSFLDIVKIKKKES